MFPHLSPTGGDVGQRAACAKCGTEVFPMPAQWSQVRLTVDPFPQLSGTDMVVIARGTSEQLAAWHSSLNTWGWPAEFGPPEPPLLCAVLGRRSVLRRALERQMLLRRGQRGADGRPGGAAVLERQAHEAPDKFGAAL